MAKKTASGGRQEHPHGPLDTVEDWWKDDVRVEMRRRGWMQKDLAREIDASEGTITNMMKPGPTQLRLVFKQRIHKAFGWPDPVKMGELIRQITRNITKLPVEEAQSIAAIVNSLVNKR